MKARACILKYCAGPFRPLKSVKTNSRLPILSTMLRRCTYPNKYHVKNFKHMKYSNNDTVLQPLRSASDEAPIIESLYEQSIQSQDSTGCNTGA